MESLSIVIPCYNEEGNVERLLKLINSILGKKEFVKFVLVDNGSTDNTLQNIKTHKLFQNSNIKLIEIKKNIGYGNGIIKGISNTNSDFIAWCHADLQTTPLDVVNAFENNLENLKKGKKVLKGKRINRNLFDQFFTIGMSFFASLVFGKKLSDINAQPKIFPKEFMKLMNNPPDDFSLDVYFLVLAFQNKYQILTHKVSWNERLSGEAKGGGSLKAKLNLVVQTIVCIIKLKFKNK